jgi:hypothetical protein
MKHAWIQGLLAAGTMLAALSLQAAPMRVALTDFDVLAGRGADAKTVGGLGPDTLARQGAFTLGQVLLEEGGFELVDRRELLDQLGKDPARPTLLRSAQQVNAGILLEGSIQSFSTRTESVKQGGHAAEFQELQMRVGLEARDTVSGAVIAMSSGSDSLQLRQTANQQVQYGESDMLNLQEKAIRQAVPGLIKAIQNYRDRLDSRPTVQLTISTDRDPALVEIDGLLIGSTPIENLSVYAGDHVITVGKAGHRDVMKRIKLDRDTRLEVPLIKTELTADEVKEILSGARLNAYLGVEPALIIEHIDSN